MHRSDAPARQTHTLGSEASLPSGYYVEPSTSENSANKGDYGARAKIG